MGKGRPDPRRELVSPEALSAGAAVGSALWASVSEIMPITAKALVGTFLALGAAGGALRAWLAKLDEKKGKDEDQQSS